MLPNRAVPDTQDIGFTGIELGGRFPRYSATLSDLLGSDGLDMVGGWCSGNLLVQDADTEAPRPHLALLKALGTDVFSKTGAWRVWKYSIKAGR